MSIDFYPLTRDCLYYAVSVLALMLVLYDGEINTLESIFLILLYAIYIFIMYYNEKLEKIAKSTGNFNLQELLLKDEIKNILQTRRTLTCQNSNIAYFGW